MGLKVEGLKELRDAFDRLRDSRGTLDRAVRDHMELDVLPAVLERTPVLTGALKATTRLEENADGGTSVWSGDSATENDGAVDYAAAVHEIVEHKHMPPTQAKYVQEPLEESVGRLKERAGRALEDLARG